MSTPQMIVHLAFGDPPLTPNDETSPGAGDGADWEDVSDYVSGDDEHMIHRGKNHERDAVEAGTAIVVLRNKDRRFDPQNNAGPYYGQLKPMVKIRIGALWGGPLDIYWLFHGYVESWQPEYPGGTVSTCTVECVDGFKYFGMIDIHTSGNRPQEQSGARIDAALTAVSWPLSERSIALGDIDVMEMQLDDSALSIMQGVTLAERGNLYISRFGGATFEDRSWRDAASPIATWGDAADGSELPYSSITVRNDDSNLYNQIEVTRRDGLLQRAYDLPSQGDFFLRRLTSTGLPYVDDTEAMAAAQVLLARYKDARPRLERMVIDPGVRDAAWIPVLSRELSDLITVKRRYLADGDVDTMDVHIEAIDYHITKGLWRVTWQLTPHFTATAGTAAVMMGSKWIDVDTGIGFQNGWVNVGGTFPDAAYWKDAEGWVHLRGLVSTGTVGTSGSTMFTLPVGYRPPLNLFQPVTTATGYGTVGVQTDGDVPAIAGGNSYFDLSSIRFKVN